MFFVKCSNKHFILSYNAVTNMLLSWVRNCCHGVFVVYTQWTSKARLVLDIVCLLYRREVCNNIVKELHNNDFKYSMSYCCFGCLMSAFSREYRGCIVGVSIKQLMTISIVYGVWTETNVNFFRYYFILRYNRIQLIHSKQYEILIENNTFCSTLLWIYDEVSFTISASRFFSLLTGITLPFLSTINLPAKFQATSPRIPFSLRNL